MRIHQDAQISRINLSKGKSFDYALRSSNHGVYVMLISGDIKIEDSILKTRDALGVWRTDSFKIEASDNAEILLIEVPMVF